MENNNNPVPKVIPDQLPVAKHNVHIKGNPENVLVGSQNTLVFFHPTQKDDDSNNNNINEDVTSDIVILSENNEVKYKYRTIPGKPTFITIGSNCDIVEIDVNSELLQKLKDTGEFQVTNGDKLVSIKWRNDEWSNDGDSYSEWKIQFIKDGKRLDTQQLEKSIFEKIVDENNNGLRNLVTELVRIHKAKLHHIEMGCIQLVLSSHTSEDKRCLEQQKEELKALLYRTIIPDSIEIELELQPKDASAQGGEEGEQAAEGQQSPSTSKTTHEDEDLPPNAERRDIEVDITDEIVRSERADRVLSRFYNSNIDAAASGTNNPNQSEKSFIEKRSLKRTVGVGPQKPPKKINPLQLEIMARRQPEGSRQLMRENSEPIRPQDSENVDIKVPMTAPIGFEGVPKLAPFGFEGAPKLAPFESEGAHGTTTLEIVNEEVSESPRSIQDKEFEVAVKNSDGASPLTISQPSTSSQGSQNTSSAISKLHSAIKNNESIQNISMMILENTTKLGEKDKNGYTALHLAVQYNNTAVVQLLLERNVDVDCENSNSDRPLHLACVTNKLDIVKLLLNNNASTHSKNFDGDTPLHLATRYGFMETIDLLIQKLRYPDTQNKMGDTSLHVAARYDICEAIDKLVSAGLSINLQNFNLDTPLLVAVKRRRSSAVRVLIGHSANINCVDKNGDSALHIAASKYDYMNEIAYMLLNHPDIDVNIYNNQRCSPAYNAHEDIRPGLMRKGSSTRRSWNCVMM